MSTPVESTFTFYGNEKIRELEKEIIRRFKNDFDKNTDSSGRYSFDKNAERYSAVTRILYGMSKDDEFDGWELLGAHGCWYFGSTHKFELESNNIAPEKLQDYIAKYASIIDPNVVVQMDYKDNNPYLIGTRIVCFDELLGFIEHKEEEELSYSWSCDIDDIDDVLEEETDLSRDDIISFQEIDERIEDLRETCIEEFNSISGRNIEFIEVDR